MTIRLLGTLTASNDDGTLSYLLLPYGEVGRTNVGKVTASKGTLTIPDNLAGIVGNLEHDSRFPVSKPVSITETDAGLMASVRPLDTTAGKDLRLEASEGVRTGISVEIDNPVIRAGVLRAGTLSGYGHVVQPAFPSAQLTASDVGDLVEDAEDTDLGEVADAAASEAADKVEDVVAEIVETVLEDAADEQDTTESTDTNGAVMNARLGAARKPGMQRTTAGQQTKAEPRGITQMIAGLAKAYTALDGSSEKAQQLTAALDQVTQADVFDVVKQPAWQGELWDGVAYEPEYSPLIAHADLTAARVQGWRFKEGKKPSVGDWAGAPNEVPSNEVAVELDYEDAKRIAAGWNIDRIHRDFPNPEFWSAFFRYSAESYAEQVDGKVKTYLTTAANQTAFALPKAEVTALTASAPEALVQIVKGARYMKRTLKVGKPTFALLSDEAYDDWLFLTSADAPEHIKAQLGFYAGVVDGLEIVNDSDIPSGVVLGVKQHATLHELGGASPLRVSTEDIAKGNLTEAMFGYYSIFQHKKTGLVAVTTAAA